MKDLIIRLNTDSQTVKKQCVFTRQEDGSVRIQFQVQNALAPHNFRTDGEITIDLDKVLP